MTRAPPALLASQGPQEKPDKWRAFVMLRDKNSRHERQGAEAIGAGRPQHKQEMQVRYKL